MLAASRHYFQKAADALDLPQLIREILLRPLRLVNVHLIIERDDGELGLALVFHALDPDERDALERALAMLPMVELPDSGEETGGLVVSEILDRAAAA